MSFDALAPHYRWMEWILAGEKLQRCRTRFVEAITEPKTILIAGEGNGRFLAVCRRRHPNAIVHCVDASSRMLELAKARLIREGLNVESVHFVHAELPNWSPPERSFDLIVTHFFLDCFPGTTLERVVAKLSRAARPVSQWLLADFQVPGEGVAKFRARLLLRLMYSFFCVVTRLPARSLHLPDPYLEAGGFERREKCVSEWGLLRSDLWERSIAH
jgi:ubiquinone/menaquinone biosynthesis C-methylase UbiE